MQRSASLWVGLGGVIVALLFCSLLIRLAGVSSPPQGKEHPIHQAAADCNLAEVQRLLSHNPSLARATDQTGRTPLHRAVSHGCTAVAKVLLVYGADVNARNRAGSTPLRWAISSANNDTVK